MSRLRRWLPAEPLTWRDWLVAVLLGVALAVIAIGFFVSSSVAADWLLTWLEVRR